MDSVVIIQQDKQASRRKIKLQQGLKNKKSREAREELKSRYLHIY